MCCILANISSAGIGKKTLEIFYTGTTPAKPRALELDIQNQDPDFSKPREKKKVF